MQGNTTGTELHAPKGTRVYRR